MIKESFVIYFYKTAMAIFKKYFIVHAQVTHFHIMIFFCFYNLKVFSNRLPLFVFPTL